MTILPTTPKLPDLRPESFKWLFMGDGGMGKSSILASIPKILVIDPDNGTAALPFDYEPIQVRSWTDCTSLAKQIKSAKETDLSVYSWIGLDLLNVTYEFCFNYMCKKLGIDYPPEDFGKTWSMITKEFVNWVRDMGSRLPVIATCHMDFKDITIKGRTFSRAIPSFPGSKATSAFKKVKQYFDIVGYITFDLTVPRESEVKDQRQVVAGDTKLINLPPQQQVEATDTRVIHFQPSQYWDAQDTSRQLPEKVVLPEDWESDWKEIQNAWRYKGGNVGD
jgi:hypothetical protein